MCKATDWSDNAAHGVKSINNNVQQYESFLQNLHSKKSGIKQNQNGSMEDDHLVDSTAPWEGLPSASYHRHLLERDDSTQKVCKQFLGYSEASQTKSGMTEEVIRTPENERILINITSKSPQRRIIFPTLYQSGRNNDFETAWRQTTGYSQTTNAGGDKGTISPSIMDGDETCCRMPLMPPWRICRSSFVPCN
jgi:hypothetical protein